MALLTYQGAHAGSPTAIELATPPSIKQAGGAELGSKANPTTTTYVPRPEWYFFFLFEVLRVIKPASLVPLATIGVPTLGRSEERRVGNEGSSRGPRSH